MALSLLFGANTADIVHVNVAGGSSRHLCLSHRLAFPLPLDEVAISEWPPGVRVSAMFCITVLSDLCSRPVGNRSYLYWWPARGNDDWVSFLEQMSSRKGRARPSHSNWFWEEKLSLEMRGSSLERSLSSQSCSFKEAFNDYHLDWAFELRRNFHPSPTYMIISYSHFMGEKTRA